MKNVKKLMAFREFLLLTSKKAGIIRASNQLNGSITLTQENEANYTDLVSLTINHAAECALKTKPGVSK